MKPKDWAALLVSVSTMLGAIGALYKTVHEEQKDQAFAWDNYGDQVAEVEKLKERLARVEATCQAPK